MGLPSPMTHKTLLPLLSVSEHLNVRYAIFFLFYSQAHFKMPIKITGETALLGVKVVVPESISNFWSRSSIIHLKFSLVRIIIGEASVFSK